jgi:hypothetical protein
MLVIYAVKPTNDTNPWHEPEMNSWPNHVIRAACSKLRSVLDAGPSSPQPPPHGIIYALPRLAPAPWSTLHWCPLRQHPPPGRLEIHEDLRAVLRAAAGCSAGRPVSRQPAGPEGPSRKPVMGAVGMRQIEGFDANDNGTDITSTTSFLRMACRPNAVAAPAAAVEEHQGLQSPPVARKPGDTDWPRWPAAWPDGSLPSRSTKADL